MTKLVPSLAALDGLTGYEAVVLFATQDERPLSGALGYLDWRLNGALSRVLKDEFFTGVPDDVLLLPTFGQIPPSKVFVIGLGSSQSATPLGFEHALSEAVKVLSKAQVESAVLAFSVLPKVNDDLKDELLKRSFSFKGQWAVFESETDAP